VEGMASPVQGRISSNMHRIRKLKYKAVNRNESEGTCPLYISHNSSITDDIILEDFEYGNIGFGSFP